MDALLPPEMAEKAEAVGEARDICVEAHQSLITAEDASARARSAFESYESESAIPAVERQRIEADVARSDRALSASSQLFSRCHRLTRDLELRYRSRRRRQ